MYKQSCYSKDPEIVRNRKDKSLLVVHTVKPELLLESSVSFPCKVKNLKIDCDVNGNISGDHSVLYFNWVWGGKYEFYTKTLLKDLVFFHNLETFTACGVRLDMDLYNHVSFHQNLLVKSMF